MKINNKLLDLEDYIVETATDGIWTYRKWNSGIAECWGTETINTAFDGTAGGVSHSGIKTAPNYPTGLFIDPPYLTGDSWGGSSNGTHSYISFTTDGTKIKPSNFYIFRNANPVSTIYTINVSYKAVGKWK